MTTVDLGVTYCCQEFHIAMVRRDYQFEIDTDSESVIVIDENEKPLEKCPYCRRSPVEYVDVEIKK